MSKWGDNIRSAAFGIFTVAAVSGVIVVSCGEAVKDSIFEDKRPDEGKTQQLIRLTTQHAIENTVDAGVAIKNAAVDAGSTISEKYNIPAYPSQAPTQAAPAPRNDVKVGDPCFLAFEDPSCY